MTDRERSAQSATEDGSHSAAADANGRTEGPSTAQLVQNLRNLAGELADYASYYVSAKVDSVKWTLTKVAMLAVLGVIGLLVFSGAVVTAVVLLVVGIADGIGAIFDPELRWIGWLITGAVIVGGLIGATLIAMRVVREKTRQRMEQKYETKRQRQQSEYGHNVRSRAADSPDAFGSS